MQSCFSDVWWIINLFWRWKWISSVSMKRHLFTFGAVKHSLWRYLYVTLTVSIDLFVEISFIYSESGAEFPSRKLFKIKTEEFLWSCETRTSTRGWSCARIFRSYSAAHLREYVRTFLLFFFPFWCRKLPPSNCSFLARCVLFSVFSLYASLFLIGWVFR